MRKPVPFGKYLLLDRIAVGGMAEVFAAKTFGVEGFERLVAIKRILPTMVEDDEFITMFKDEANIASALQHANLVQIFDLGKHDDTFYIAMEYISGRDVRLIIEKFRKQKKVMPVVMACFIMARMCEGLDYAHRKTDAHGQPLEIIHRDISPQNVLVSYEGGVKIIDFGIAKAAGRLQQTQAGILKGKFAYMSPEQVRGIPIDHRSDIYSAGAMFFEMLTGTKLFSGESDFSTLEKVRAGEVPPPSAINPLVTPELEKIVYKALAKDRDKRYQWPGELQDDLTRFLYSRDEIFSTKALGEFMEDAFEVEVSKEQQRVRRWWATTPEETSDFDVATFTPTAPPKVVPSAVEPTPQLRQSSAPKVRVGPPATFGTGELRLQEQTSLHTQFPADESQAPSPPPRAASNPRAAVSAPPPVRSSYESTSSPALAPLVSDPSDFSLTSDTNSGRAQRRRTNTQNRVISAATAERARIEAARQAELHRGLPPPSIPLTSNGLTRFLPAAIGLLVFAAIASVGVYTWKQLQAPTHGAYIINVVPVDGLEVRIDGEVPAPSMLPQGRLLFGTHHVSVEAPDHESYSTDFEVTNKPTVMVIKLERIGPDPKDIVEEQVDDEAENEAEEAAQASAARKRAEAVRRAAKPVVAAPAKTATLVVYTVPRNGSVTVNGVAYGNDYPVQVNNLPRGTPLKIVAELEGYKTTTQTEEIRLNDSEKTVRVYLSKPTTVVHGD